MATKMLMEPQKVLAAASVGASYTAVGTGLVNPSRQFLVQNLTNATLQFSFDGVNDHFPLIANGAWDSDNNTNKNGNDDYYLLPVGTILYVKQIGTPSTGSVYFSSAF